MRRGILAAVTATAIVAIGSVAVIEHLHRDAPPPAARPAPAPAPASTAAPPEPTATPPAAPELPPQAPAPAAQPRRSGPPRPTPVRLAAPRAGASRIELSFKMDPRLTRSLHMGDRWISPATYSQVGGPRSVGVHARARVVPGGDERPSRALAWTASEPDMVQVSPEEGPEVEITVWRAGESSLTVNAGGLRRTLLIRATQVPGGFRVHVSQ